MSSLPATRALDDWYACSTELNSLRLRLRCDRLRCDSMQKSIESFLAGRKRPVEERAGAASTSKRQCHDDSDASLTPEENVWLDDNVSDFDSDITDEENVDGDVSVVSTPSVSTVRVKPSLTPPGPKDISAGRSDNPMQPKLSAFPTTQFGMKRRSFSPRWYEVYPWLEYSVSQDAAFCFCCRLFPLPGKSIAEKVFTVSGYRQWKKATEKDSGFAQHERSDYHNSAFCAWKDFRSYIETGKAIDVALVSAHDKQVQENRHYIKQVAKVLCYYSVMVNESKDVSGKEQLSVVVRYLYQNNIHEEFLDFARLREFNANYLKDKLVQVLNMCNIAPSNCVGQTKDGASVMSGVRQGVQSLFRQSAPMAVYIHCYNHRLNLVIVDCVKSVKLADRFFGMLEALYVFMSSHVPHEIYLKKQEEMFSGKQPQKLKKLSDTRWSCQYLSCKVLLDTLPAVIETLRILSETHTGKRVHHGESLLRSIDHGMIICLVLFTHVLKKTKLLSDMLQSPSLDLSAAADMVQTVQGDLSTERNEKTWHVLWSKAEEIRNETSIPAEIPPGSKRTCKPPTRLQDSVVMAYTGQQDSEGTPRDSVEHRYCVNLYYPVLDKLQAELSSRFDEANKSLLRAVSVLDPCSAKFLDINLIKPMAEQYSVDTTYLDVELKQARRLIDRKTHEGVSVKSLVELSTFLNPYKEAFPDLYKLITIALVLPPTSASCERSFSSMRHIKSYLRSTMSDNKL